MTSRRDHDPDWREQTTKYTPQEQKIIARIICVLVVLMIGLLLGTQLFHEEHGVVSGDYNLNLYIGVLSFIATVLLVEALNALRDIRVLKDRLVHEARSQSNERAKAAIEDLRHYEWLEGENGLLKGAHLVEANLAGAGLRGANLSDAHMSWVVLSDTHMEGINLQGAILAWAKLHSAILGQANLSGATLLQAELQNANLTATNFRDAQLIQANLQGAVLHFSDLNGADLLSANLQNTHLQLANLSDALLWGANLSNADLRGTRLEGANLQGAVLTNAIFSEDTTMPNGEKWRADMDVTMFTDPDHPNFYTPSRRNLLG
jgi:uncharacterized protein YjbI with pentapeptide repeats